MHNKFIISVILGLTMLAIGTITIDIIYRGTVKVKPKENPFRQAAWEGEYHATYNVIIRQLYFKKHGKHLDDKEDKWEKLAFEYNKFKDWHYTSKHDLDMLFVDRMILEQDEIPLDIEFLRTAQRHTNKTLGVKE